METYKLVVNLTANAVNATTPIAAFTDPNGDALFSAGSYSPGWNVTRSINNITVTHPIGRIVMNAHAHGKNGANLITRAFIGTTLSAFSCIQTDALTSVTFSSLTGTNTGAASAGDTTITITFQFA